MKQELAAASSPLIRDNVEVNILVLSRVGV